MWSAGDLIKQYEVPLSRMLHDILDDDHLQWHPPLIRHYTNFWSFYWSGPYNRIWLFTELREVSIEHLQRVRMPTEDAYSSGHLVLSHFGNCKCCNVETYLSWTCLVSGLLSFEHPSVLLSLPLSHWHVLWIHFIFRLQLSAFLEREYISHDR